MSRSLPLPRTARHVSILLLVALSGALTACGGGGSSASLAPSPPPSGGTPPPPAPVEGVATPTSVAVVTATNAQ